MEIEDYHIVYLTPDLKRSTFEGKELRKEVVFEHHMLLWLISGHSKITLADAVHEFKGGDIFLIPRNKLAAITTSSIQGEPYRAVAMYFTPQRLKAFYKKHKPLKSASPLDKVRVFTKHPLLESCMVSLVPYFDLTDKLPEDIAALKIEEAINILRTIDPEVDGMLSSFERPGKINLGDFMNKHFMFNMSLEKFGYLTGRSLSTFNRDFRKIFNTTPQRWLTDQRLEHAHYQLAEKKRKPVDVYIEAGFENLSHFSYAFKKRFGYAPSEV